MRIEQDGEVFLNWPELVFARRVSWLRFGADDPLAERFDGEIGRLSPSDPEGLACFDGHEAVLVLGSIEAACVGSFGDLDKSTAEQILESVRRGPDLTSAA